MSNVPADLLYTESHEWVRKESDGEVTIGITDHAQAQLGELVFVELPELESEFSAGDDAAVVESVKTASDVYAPVSGDVVAVNEALNDNPSLVNEDPYGDGWLFKIKLSKAEELDNLMAAEAYDSETA